MKTLELQPSVGHSLHAVVSGTDWVNIWKPKSGGKEITGWGTWPTRSKAEAMAVEFLKTPTAAQQWEYLGAMPKSEWG
jgi:hypothetical protein